MNRLKRILSVLLALMMTLSLLPAAVFASKNNADTKAGESVAVMQMGVGTVDGYNAAENTYDYLYYGIYDNNPIKWRVLDDKTNMKSAVNGDGLFLLSEQTMAITQFNPNLGTASNIWKGSVAQKWCQDFYANNLSSVEKSAVIPTTKSDGVYLGYAKSGLSDDKIFFLSVEEAETKKYGFINNDSRIADNSVWWLRSPFSSNGRNAGTVSAYGATGFKLTESQNI